MEKKIRVRAPRKNASREQLDQAAHLAANTELNFEQIVSATGVSYNTAKRYIAEYRKGTSEAGAPTRTYTRAEAVSETEAAAPFSLVLDKHNLTLKEARDLLAGAIDGAEVMGIESLSFTLRIYTEDK